MEISVTGTPIDPRPKRFKIEFDVALAGWVAKKIAPHESGANTVQIVCRALAKTSLVPGRSRAVRVEMETGPIKSGPGRVKKKQGRKNRAGPGRLARLASRLAGRPAGWLAGQPAGQPLPKNAGRDSLPNFARAGAWLKPT